MMGKPSGMNSSLPLVAFAVCLSAGFDCSPVLAAHANSEPQIAPSPIRDLSPGISRYKASIAAQGQNMTLDITTEIKEQSGVWLATESTQTPVGQAEDAVLMEKRTLLLRERHIRQGPLRVDLTFSGNRALGQMAMTKSGEIKKIDVDLGGPLFADSAGALQSLAALPLAEGYKTTFRNFDLQTRKPKLMQLVVLGSESVSVPAGSFEAWKVEITSADVNGKTTVWISKLQPAAVKYTANLNGASVTAELVP
jgi:hypothetical protein